MLKTTIRIKSFFIDEYINMMIRKRWRLVKFIHIMCTICIFERCRPDQFICKIAWLNKDSDDYSLCHNYITQHTEKEEFYAIPLRKESENIKDNLLYLVYPNDYFISIDLFSSYNRMIVSDLHQNIFCTLFEILIFIVAALYYTYMAFCKLNLFNVFLTILYNIATIGFIENTLLVRKVIKNAERDSSHIKHE